MSDVARTVEKLREAASAISGALDKQYVVTKAISRSVAALEMCHDWCMVSGMIALAVIQIRSIITP
jgi:hypothetical protein